MFSRILIILLRIKYAEIPNTMMNASCPIIYVVCSSKTFKNYLSCFAPNINLSSFVPLSETQVCR